MNIRRSRRAATAIVAVVALVAAAGCAAEGPAPRAAPPTTTEAPPTVTEAPALPTTTEAPAPPTTPEAPPAATAETGLFGERAAELRQALAEAAEAADPEDMPPAEVVEQVMEAVEEAAPGSEMTLNECTDWVAGAGVALDDTQSAECVAILSAAVAECETLDCATEPGTEPDPQPGSEPGDAPDPWVDPDPDPEPEPESEPTTTTAPPEPEPESEPTTTTAPPEPEPEPEPGSEPEPESEPEPAATTTTAPLAVQPISQPLQRCAPVSVGSFGAERVSVLVSNAEGGVYQAVAQGEPDSCEIVMAWWDATRQAEADRIAQGQYPCGYLAAYGQGRDTWWNGVPYLVGCWPQHLEPGERLDDPDAEANRLRWGVLYSHPPNYPAFVRALWDCYRMVLEGPPEGWEPQNADGFWPRTSVCNSQLFRFGFPVRDLGVDPDCAAEQYTGRLAELRDGTYRTQEHSDGYWTYSGDYSWANCSTDATRVLRQAGVPDDAPYSERCEAVVDASAAAILEAYGYITDYFGDDHDTAIATVKAMHCADGTKATLKSFTQFRGEDQAAYLPPEGSPCLEKAMLGAAWWALSGHWINVSNC